MARREREILEQTVRTLAEQAAKADDLADDGKAAGGGDHQVTIHAKMLRLELLKVKADLDPSWRRGCRTAPSVGSDVCWVSGLGVTPGTGHTREPAPPAEPSV